MSEIVITSISGRSGGGWSAYGERFPSSSYSCTIDDWHGSTSETLADLLPGCYILKSAWDSLSDDVKANAYSRVIDIVDSNYGISGTDYWDGRRYCTRDFNSDSIISNYKDKFKKVCEEGEKRNPKPCWDGTTIHEQVCRNNAWVPSGETCPPKPECTEGDKKAGYVCVAGKWQTAPAVPEPVVPPVEPPVAPPKHLTPAEAEERIKAGLPCYIKCVLPVLDLLPGIPYTPGMWVPPFCAITTKP